MSRRGVGVTLIAIAAFLYGVRYITAAVFGSGINTWKYVGPNLNYAAAVALFAGVVYLIWGELSDRREWEE